MPYLGKTPSQATRKRYYKTASGSETSISGTMTVGGTLTFTDGEFVDVSVNGVALVAGTDYNTDTANTIAGLSALSANDQVEIVVYDTFSVFSGDVDSNMSVGGNLSVTGTATLTGNADFNGDLDVDGTTNLDAVDIDGNVDIATTATLTCGAITSSISDHTNLTLTSTNADANAGPKIVLNRDSGSPADGDATGEIIFKADDDGGNSTEFAKIETSIIDASDTTEDGRLIVRTITAGTATSRLDFTNTETVFNDSSIDVDFRVESNGDANMLFVDGGNDAIGIGTSSPLSSSKLHIFEAARNGGYGINGSRDSLIIEDSQHAGMSICGGAGNGGTASIAFPNGSNNIDGLINYDLDSRFLSFHSAAGERFRLDSSGHLNFACTTISPGLGNTDTGTAIRSDGIIANSSASGYVSINKNGDGTRIQFNNSGNTRGTITVTGTTTAYNTSSDRRLKSNIQDAASASSKIDAMKVRQFDWTEDGKHQDYGMIAQELQSIEPLAVSGSEDSTDMMGVDYSKLVPMLVKEIQELRSRVAALEAS